MELTAPDNEAVNVGQIIANSGKIGIYAGLVRNSGVIRADGVVVGEHGEILLKATGNMNIETGSVVAASGAQGGNITIQSGDTTLVSGTIEAKGSEGQGGTVQLLGNRVGVIDGALVDASGQAGGGTVLVGGDYQGRNPDVQNAWRTYVGPTASIHADAIASGDGGKVIVWSDDATRVYGSISARGGAQSGNGGFVETSGHSLEVTRGPDISAPSGTAGTWLLDPVDLNVVPGFAVVNNTSAPFFSPLADSSSIGVELINAQLNFGSNVVLTTTSQGPTAGTQAGNITVSAPIVKSAATTTGPGGVVIGPTSLTMQAHNNIVIDGAGSITSTGDALNVTLAANNFSGTGNGGVTVGGAITTNGGLVNISGRGPIAVNAPINTTRNLAAPGSVFLTSVTAGVTVAAPVNGGSFAAFAGGAGSLLTLAAPVTAIGQFTSASLTADDMEILGLLSTGAGGIFVSTATANRPMSLGGAAAGSLSLVQPELSNLSTTGLVQFSSSGAATVSGAVTLGSSSVSINSGSSFNVSPGASLNTAVPLSISAPTGTTIDGPINAQRVSFTTGTMAVNAQVTSATDINISTSNPVALGDGVGGGLHLDNSELGRLSNGTANALRISGGAMTIQNSITRTAAQGALSLTGSSLTQEVGDILNVSNLFLNFGTVNLPEANNIGMLAGFVSNLNLSNASLLTIGSVDGTSGMFTSTATLKTDDQNVANTFSGSTINIMPLTSGRTLNLGGADVAGQLNISGTDLGNIRGTTVNLSADTANIGGPVSASTSTSVLTIAPVTATRQLNIVAAKLGGALEFTQGDITNVTANSFTLGDFATGPVAVNANLAVPSSITGTFTLRSGDTATGITVNNPLSANRSLALISDTMNLNANVTSNTGDITIAPNTAGRPIDLGSKPASTLGLNATELSRISAPSGTLFFGNSVSGDLTVSAPVTLANSTFLTANVMNINNVLTTTAGDITVAPGASRNITLGTDDVVGTTLGFTSTEIDKFTPAGVLRIGDFSNTNAISVTAAIAPANTTILSLLARNSISQTLSSTITETNLRASSSSSSVNLTENNSVVTLAGSSSGSFSFTNAVPLTIGTVDTAIGISDSAVTLRSNEISINANISASSVTLRPLSAGTLINIGTNVGAQHSFDQAELNRISASSVTIGDATSGALTVSAPVSISTFSDLTLTTGATAAVNNALSVPRNLNINAGIINTTAALTSSSGNITMVADSMTIGAGVSALSGTISLQPINPLTTIDLGGPDVVSTTNTLGFNATDQAALFAGALSFGGSNTPSISVTAATNLGATPTSLTTAGAGTINVNAALTTGDLALTTDNLVVLTGSVAAPNVTLNTVTVGRTVDLGTHIVGASLGLDQADLNRITTPGTLTVNNTGLINVSAPVSFPNAANLTLHGDTMTIGNTVTSTVGGRITVAPRSFRAMNLGTNPVAGALGLTAAEIDRFVTSGVLQLGDTATTSSITISDLIAPAGVSTVTLAANGSIAQAAGKTITESNLRINTFGSVNLTENNSVGTLAGSSSGSFSFTGTGALNIGTVDGATGISDSTVTIKADTLTLSQPISGGNVTLAPRVAGAPIDLGSKPAGVFGITDAEMDQFFGSAFNLTFGNSTAGPINVSSAMTRNSGVLNIVTGAAQTVNINANLSAPSGISVTGGSTNVAAPVSSSSGSVTLTSDSMNLGAPITSPGTVTLMPLTTGRPIELGTENAAALSLTAAEINQVNASSLTSSLTIGSSASGPLNVSAPIAPAGGTTSTSLTLRAGGAITQNPGATVVTKKLNVNPVTGITTVTGSLGVFSTNGTVALPEANDVGMFLSGSSGGANKFVFNNVGPLKLQNVSVFSPAKTLINAGFFVFVPPAVVASSTFDICSVLPEICSPRNLFDDDRFDPDKDKDKDADKNKNICAA